MKKKLKVNRFMKEKKIIIIILTITITFILVDQLSKFLIKTNYNSPIGNEIISVQLIQNEGLAFGLNNGNTKNIVITIIVLIIVINFVVKQYKRITLSNAIAVGLILAGGISNLIDRLFRGGVVDFIKVGGFAIFNIADCCVVLGWIILVIVLIKETFPELLKKNK